MEKRTVQLQLAGQTYRVVTTAPEADLRRFAAVVEAKLAEVSPRGRAPAPQAMLLAAMSLAHDVEAERARSRAVEERAKELLGRVLSRIDEALGEEEAATPAPPTTTP